MLINVVLFTLSNYFIYIFQAPVTKYRWQKEDGEGKLESDMQACTGSLDFHCVDFATLIITSLDGTKFRSS